MAVTSKGSFFLFDYTDTQIRRYNAAGRFLGLVGRSGGGPGEYRQIMGMAVAGDSILLVYDPGQRRMTVFDTGGSYRRSFPFQRAALFGPKAFFVDQAGIAYVRGGLPQAPIEGLGIPSQFYKVAMDGSIRDSIPVPAERGPPRPFLLITADGGRENFPEKNVFTLLPSGEMVSANTGTYRFTVTTARFGSHIVERAFTPIPVTGEERDQWEAFARYFATREGRQRVAEIPRVKPAFRDIFADLSGRIWVNLYTKAEKRNIPPRPAGDKRPLLTIREVNVYELFDLRGRYLGQLSLPPASVIMAVSGDRIWVKTEAEGGEFTLTRYRIGGLPPG
jgi:hypothetical protein